MKKFRLRIERDEDPCDPRKDCDNLGTMVCWHRRYTLGDEQPGGSLEWHLNGLAEVHLDDAPDDCSREKIDAALEKGYVILPLYLYDHSGITMSTGAFSCPRDSGQIGFIFVSLEKMQREYREALRTGVGEGWDAVIPWDMDGNKKTIRDAAKFILNQEVETYDKYLRGDVWGFIVESSEDDEEWAHEDSCWGFLGEEYCREEGESMLKMLFKLHEGQEEEFRREVEPFLPGIDI